MSCNSIREHGPEPFVIIEGKIQLKLKFFKKFQFFEIFFEPPAIRFIKYEYKYGFVKTQPTNTQNLIKF